jgi:hypothetical protein
MKYIASVFLVFVLFDGPSGGAMQLGTTYYSLRVAGKVIFKKRQSPPGATVYVMWNGPVNGRIPWAHANKDGTFLIEFSRSADDYHICAHPGETNGLLPLARTPGEAKKMPIKLSCTKDFPLDGKHLEQRDVQLKLR